MVKLVEYFIVNMCLAVLISLFVPLEWLKACGILFVAVYAYKVVIFMPDDLKHGHWEFVRTCIGTKEFLCSVCMRKHHSVRSDVLPKYCPKCGAEMEDFKDETN